MRPTNPVFGSRLAGQIGLLVLADRISPRVFEVFRGRLVGDCGVGFGHWLAPGGPKGPRAGRGAVVAGAGPSRGRSVREGLEDLEVAGNAAEQVGGGIGEAMGPVLLGAVDNLASARDADQSSEAEGSDRQPATFPCLNRLTPELCLASIMPLRPLGRGVTPVESQFTNLNLPWHARCTSQNAHSHCRRRHGHVAWCDELPGST